MASTLDVLGTISQGGTDFTNWYNNMRLGEVQEAANAAAKMKAEKQAASKYENDAGLSNDQIFNMFRKAIAQQESGGDYDARGTWLDMSYGRDRAYGKYQVMGNNIPSWTQDVLGKAMTPKEFLRDHQAQEQVARAKLWGAYKSFETPKEAAMSWFAGAGGVANPGPATVDYGKDIMERMRNYGYTNRDPQQQTQVGPNGLVMPVKGADITDSYGWRTHPVTGERSFHTGTDFSAAGGTPVRAMADGRIISMEYDPIYGWQTIIKSKGGDLQTMYGHMSKFNKNLDEGMRIDAGTRIGRVGTTGLSTGNHLHFEVERNGENVNPLKYLKHNNVGRFGSGQQQGPIRPSSGPRRPPRNNGQQAGQQTGSSLNSLLQGYNLI